MEEKFDYSTLIGILAAFAVIGIAIAVGGKASFVDYPAILIVVGGTFAVTMACFSLPEVWQAQRLVLKTMMYHAEDPREVSRRLLEQGEEARKNGILALQQFLDRGEGTEFWRKGLGLTVDGMEPDAVENILRQDIGGMIERHFKSASILRKSAEVSPAMGLVATLIGLVQLLGNLNDPASIGPSMAVALLGTFYGATLSYIVFSPLAAKLERNSQEEVLVNKLYMKGILAIGRNENPRRTEIVFNSMLPPAQRITYFG